MTLHDVAPEASTPAPTVPPRSHLVRGSGWALLACWLVVVAQWWWAPSPARWMDLEADAARIDTVEIIGGVGQDANADALGHRYGSIVRVVWHQGWRRYETAAIESSTVKRPGVRILGRSDSDLSLTSPVSDVEAEVRMRDVRAEIAKIAPHATITEADLPDQTWSLYDRRMPAWTVWLGLLCAFGTLVHLLVGPRPWRATRWAWFWLLGLPLVGGPLYLLSSGATLQRPPPPWARPLTGGIALILTLIVGGMIDTVIS